MENQETQQSQKPFLEVKNAGFILMMPVEDAKNGFSQVYLSLRDEMQNGGIQQTNVYPESLLSNATIFDNLSEAANVINKFKDESVKSKVTILKLSASQLSSETESFIFKTFDEITKYSAEMRTLQNRIRLLHNELNACVK